MTASESSDGSGAKGKVVTLRSVKAGEAGVKKPVDPALVYFPDGLKRHYMDLLLRYKQQLSNESGKAVGWLAIRDRIMAREDALEAEAKQRSGYGVKVDRPRSDLVRLDDFKGWYNPKNSHLPTNMKFQYIDRFIRGLRVDGKLDAIELTVSEAQREYFRESLAQFYRPDRAFDRKDEWVEQRPIGECVPEVLDGASFVGACIYDPTIFKGDAPRSALAREKFAVVFLCREYRQCSVPVEVVACFLPDRAWNRNTERKGPFSSVGWDLLGGLELDDLRIVHLFSGFLVPESSGVDTAFSRRIVSLILVARKESRAGVWHEGLARATRRFYSPGVQMYLDDNPVLVWPAGASDSLVSLGLQYVEPDNVKTQRRGLVKVGDTELLRKLRSKFAIGYRPC